MYDDCILVCGAGYLLLVVCCVVCCCVVSCAGLARCERHHHHQPWLYDPSLDYESNITTTTITISTPLVIIAIIVPIGLMWNISGTRRIAIIDKLIIIAEAEKRGKVPLQVCIIISAVGAILIECSILLHRTCWILTHLLS